MTRTEFDRFDGHARLRLAADGLGFGRTFSASPTDRAETRKPRCSKKRIEQPWRPADSDRT